MVIQVLRLDTPLWPLSPIGHDFRVSGSSRESGEQDGTNCPKRVSNLQMYRTRLSLNVDNFATDIKNDSLPKYRVIHESNKAKLRALQMMKVGSTS